MSVVCDHACRAQLLKFWSKVLCCGTYSSTSSYVRYSSTYSSVDTLITDYVQNGTRVRTCVRAESVRPCVRSTRLPILVVELLYVVVEVGRCVVQHQLHTADNTCGEPTLCHHRAQSLKFWNICSKVVMCSVYVIDGTRCACVRACVRHRTYVLYVRTLG